MIVYIFCILSKLCLYLIYFLRMKKIFFGLMDSVKTFVFNTCCREMTFVLRKRVTQILSVRDFGRMILNAFFLKDGV